MQHKRKFDKVIEKIDWAETKSVLDMGCGGGQFIIQAAKEHTNVEFTGVDISCASVTTARKLFESSPNCMVLEGTVYSLPFSDMEFDVVTAFAAVYYWEDIEKSFAELYRVQKEDGTIYIECTQSSHNYDRKNALLERKMKGTRFYDVKAIMSAMKKAGYHSFSAFKTKWPFFICIIAVK